MNNRINLSLLKHGIARGLFIFIIVIFIGCEVVVDVPRPDFNPSLVLNGFFNSDSTITIQLSSNRYVLDSHEFSPIQGATVKLFAAADLVAEFNENTISGSYSANFIPKNGIEYTINVDKDGFASINASGVIPLNIANFEINKIEKGVTEYGGSVNELTYSLYDKNGKNFYETRLMVFAKTYDFIYVEEEDSLYQVYLGDQIQESHYSIEKGDLNGFEESDDQKTFSDELFDGNKKETTIRFHDYYGPLAYGAERDTVKFILQVRHLSEACYTYKTSSYLQWDTNGDPFAEPVQVYNNINNGYGIFAGYNTNSIEFEIIVEY